MSRRDFSDGSDTDSSCKSHRIRRLMELRDQEQLQDSREDESIERESMDMSEDIDGDTTSSMDEGDDTRNEEGDAGIKNLKNLGPGGKGPWCCFTVCNGEKVPFAWFATAEMARQHLRLLDEAGERCLMEDEDVAQVTGIMG